MIQAPTAERDLDARDAAFVRRMAAGDHGEPVAALYEAHAGALLRFGRRLLRDEEQAQDLVQETFVRLWRSAAGYDPRQASVRGFLFLLAHRVGVDMLRRAAARPPRAAGETAEVADGGEALADRVAREFTVRAAVAGLPAKHREVIELVYDRDLAPQAAAEALGVPVGTVRSRIFYALRTLRAELGEAADA